MPRPAPIPHLTRIQRALLGWQARHGMAAPWRDTRDPYRALVAAVMAQQTQMSRVLPMYQRFIAAFPTVDDLARATRGDVIRTWQGMGYNQRAVRLHEAARRIAAEGWPPDAPALARLDGVGPYTAAIVASYAFGQPAAAVDTNVVRILTRLAGDPTLRGARLQALADACMSGAAARRPALWNQALMDYGARVCLPRPRCGDCVVASLCPSRDAAPPPRLVADARTPDRAAPRFEHTPRYFRGRIVDALRALPPGRSLTHAALRAAIANTITPGEDDVRAWVAALERAGLVETHRGRVRLPA